VLNFLAINKKAIPVVSFVSTNLLQDSNDKYQVSFSNEVSRDVGNFMRHDMIQNWTQSHFSSQYLWFALFPQPRFPLCCADSV
jgi:hypothetical protein